MEPSVLPVRWCHLSHFEELLGMADLKVQTALNQQQDRLSMVSSQSELEYRRLFLWGFLKQRVYKNTPASLHGVKIAIRNKIKAIPVDMLQRCIKHFEKRLGACIGSKGGHFETLLWGKRQFRTLSFGKCILNKFLLFLLHFMNCATHKHKMQELSPFNILRFSVALGKGRS